MATPRILLKLAALLFVPAFGLSAAATAAAFRNLDFEAAITNSLSLDSRNNTLVGSVADLLPGWEVFQGTNQLASIAYNGSSAFSDNVGGPMLIGRDSTFIDLLPPIAGQFSFAILASVGGRTPEPWTLVQRGDIPADARFLSFNYQGEVPLVRIGGVTLLSAIPAVRFQNPIRLDISQFAGKNVELEFGTPGFPLSSLYEIDSIAFVVPEPSTWVLFGLGGLILLCTPARRRLSR